MGTKNSFVISIPSGTIKREQDFLYQESCHKFQFLLVRLKACLAAGKKQYIKTFQFLLVRLKETLKRLSKKAVEISIPSGTIKSHVLTYNHVLTNKISIPSGTIKRLIPILAILSLFNFNSFWYD